MGAFEPGTIVALREILRERVWAARPAIVVRDEPELQMFYVPIGARWRAPDVGDREDLIRTKALAEGWTLLERTWAETHVLSFARPGAGHAILHFWDAGWEPRSWYVNVQQPLRRYDVGFDTLDEDLDVLVAPDRSSWSWKDEEDVALGIELGLYAPEQATAFREEASRGRDELLHRVPPFDREWGGWRPDPSWAVPVLPEGWDRLGP